MNEIYVHQIMSRDVLAVAPETSVRTVERLLESNNIHGVPVIGSDGQALGVVTMADLVRSNNQTRQELGIPIFYQINDGWASVHGDLKHASPGRVLEVMNPTIFVVDEQATLQEAAARLLSSGTRQVFVVRDGMVTGVVSTRDLVRTFLLHETRQANGDELALLASTPSPKKSARTNDGQADERNSLTM